MPYYSFSLCIILFHAASFYIVSFYIVIYDIFHVILFYNTAQCFHYLTISRNVICISIILRKLPFRQVFFYNFYVNSSPLWFFSVNFTVFLYPLISKNSAFPWIRSFTESAGTNTQSPLKKLSAALSCHIIEPHPPIHNNTRKLVLSAW